MNETPSLLTVCLDRLQWSPERLASEINKRFGVGTISSKAPYNWLKGARPRRRLPVQVAEILTECLGEPISAEALWPRPLPPSETARPIASVPPVPGAASARVTMTDLVNAAVDWLVDDGSALPVRAGGQEVPEIAIQMLSARVDQLRGVDDISSTKLGMEWALQELQSVRRLAMEHSYDEQIGVYLHRLIAELAQVAGWLSADMGLRRQSRSCFMSALAAARTARDRPLAAYIISQMAYQSMWEDREEEGLRLIGIARKGIRGDGPGACRALLATREARIRAALGDDAGCERFLSEVTVPSLDGDRQADPPWIRWVTPAVMMGDAGRAWLELGRCQRAERFLERGIAMFGDSQPRNRMLHATSLAEARLGLREVEGAAEATGTALSLAEAVTSRRAQIRLSSLRRQFLLYDSVTAREVAQRIAEFLDADGQRTVN